ncbi:MAG: hypothetical protein K5908_08850 [Erysipelotrichaceae bacterium]|nr:hypothetical protein [Erysipelotrichaceae bacterium]
MINKYTLSRSQEISFVKQHLDEFIANNIFLSRYSDDDPLKPTAEANFYETYEYILSHPEVENDYKCLLQLHKTLMKGLDDGIHSELSEQQIEELSLMINQPVKANLEIAIDVFLYILDKRLFTDGDVRAAMAFSNKIMVDNGCGFLTVPIIHKDTFRAKLKEYKDSNDYDLKDWVYKYCVKGPKLDQF